MTDDERNEFQKAMRKADSRIKHRVDSELAEFRPMYERLSPEEKTKLKDWIGKVADVQELQPRICMDTSLKVALQEQIGEEEYRTVNLPVKVLRNAMETWDRGECYTPKTIGELWSQ